MSPPQSRQPSRNNSDPKRLQHACFALDLLAGTIGRRGMVSVRRRALLGGLVATVALLPPLDAVSAKSENTAFERQLLEAEPAGADMSLGATKAEVTLIEYGSVTSSSCAEFHKNVLPVIQHKYIDTGLVRYVFREYPTDQTALMVSMLMRCVPETKYFSTLDMLFQRQSLWKGGNIKSELLKIMRSTGMSENGFIACLRRKELAHAIHETRRKARDEFGVVDAPTFFVNGRKVDDHNDVTAVLSAIEAALKPN